TGQNAVNQAREFKEATDVSGVVITKLDGTPKGGALFGIARDLELPILYIGVGENMDDLVEFRADEFVDTLVEGIYA
ncbi:MAG: signal recognition particle-docking protein FtsY, partial [Campylobacter sp.]|nr:signal recognition particle-docking protein FtsY [Campylobacter sp.]